MNASDCFELAIPSIALSIALYTFLADNSKFREFSKRFWGVVMLQLLSIMCCSLMLLTEAFVSFYPDKTTGLFLNIVNISFQDLLTVLFLLFFVVSWVYLCRIFYIMYGSLYHLRNRRFIKYTKPVSWFYEKFFHKTFYEKNYRERTTLKFDSFEGISPSIAQKVRKGGSILILYDDIADYSNLVANYIRESIGDGETVDFIATCRSPIEICRSINEEDIPKITRRLSIIDCFSPHYSFDDKVMKFAKQDYMQKGFKFYNAESFARPVR